MNKWKNKYRIDDFRLKRTKQKTGLLTQFNFIIKGKKKIKLGKKLS